jgi:VWFA-related protein
VPTAFAGALVAGFVLAAAAARPQTPPPRFATETELVTVDVVVLDHEGQPVTGLQRHEFRVLEDGRGQAVTAFQAIEATAPALVAPETTTARPSDARVATNVAGPPTRRTFAIVFDDLHIGDLNVEQAKRATVAFVDREVRPGDRLVLFTVSDARFWATSRGREDAAWRDALQRVRSRRPPQELLGCRVAHYEAMRIEDVGDAAVSAMVARRLGRLCPEDRLMADALAVVAAGGGSGSAGSYQRKAKIANAYIQARALLGRSLRVVREIARSLGASPGRKSLVLVTEGFPVDPSLDVFREVREQAARSNVVLHFLDARGLATGPEYLQAAGTTELPSQDVALMLALWRLEDSGSKALAQETGGLVLQTNDLVAGLETVAEDSRAYYLLGYEPANAKRDGRYRKLKVEVLKPGLSVRARAGYFAPKGKGKPAPEPSVAERVLRNPFDADGVPLRLAAYVMGPAPLQSPVPKTGVEVLIAGEVRLDALHTRLKDGRVVAEPKLTLVASSRSGEAHESDWTLEIALEPPAPGAEAAKAWHPFLTRIAMSPGDHRARLVVESGGRVGSVTVDFDVPDFAEERLSTPILSDQLVGPGGLGAGGGGARRVMPVVRRSFPATSTLHGWIELHGAARDPETGQPKATASFAVRSADGREWASGAAIAMSLESGKPTRQVSMPLSGAPDGESELVLTVHDQVSGRTLEAREPFRVERGGHVPPARNPDGAQ